MAEEVAGEWAFLPYGISHREDNSLFPSHFSSALFSQHLVIPLPTAGLKNELIYLFVG